MGGEEVRRAGGRTPRTHFRDGDSHRRAVRSHAGRRRGGAVQNNSSPSDRGDGSSRFCRMDGTTRLVRERRHRSDASGGCGGLSGSRHLRTLRSPALPAREEPPYERGAKAPLLLALQHDQKATWRVRTVGGSRVPVDAHGRSGDGGGEGSAGAGARALKALSPSLSFLLKKPRSRRPAGENAN